MAIPAVILGGRIICRWLGFCITVLTISCVCVFLMSQWRRIQGLSYRYSICVCVCVCVFNNDYLKLTDSTSENKRRIRNSFPCVRTIKQPIIFDLDMVC